MCTSLKGRLIFAASLTVVVFLGLLANALESAFRQSLSDAKEQELRLHTHSLLVAANPSQTSLELPDILPDDRFNLLDSGLYAVIRDVQGNLIWHSASASAMSQNYFIQFSNTNSDQASTVGFKHFKRSATPAATHSAGEATDSIQFDAGADEFFFYEHTYAWQTLDGVDRLFDFQIMEDARGFEMQADSFRSMLWKWMFVAAVIMVLILWVGLLWTLRPLSKIAAELRAVESGKVSELSEAYPKELRGISRNLNLLLKNEKLQRERYRQTLSDLAHSLKTPLAILYGLGAGSSSTSTSTLPSDQHVLLNEQVERMNEIVSYQLQRAVASNPGSILSRIPVDEPVKKILNALGKVYAMKSIQVSTDIDPKAAFYGDKGDFMEVLGNLLDNAFKYGGGEIKLTIEAVPQQNSPEGRTGLAITIEDNGAGIPQNQHERLFARGQRADTREPGQGIGLAVVKDIVTSYGGKISLAQSSLGGACFQLFFP